MVTVTRMNGEAFVLNALMVELVEATPDTVVTLLSGKKFVVRESATELVAMLTEYYKRIGLLPGLAVTRHHAGDIDES